MASKTEALEKESTPSDRDLIELSDQYADTKQEEYTAELDFFLEEFTTIPPPSLFEAVIQEQVKLRDFSKAFGTTMSDMVNGFLQRSPYPFYIDPQTLVVTVGSHFMEKAIRKKFALKDNLQTTE